jgi:hypothetical protein
MGGTCSKIGKIKNACEIVVEIPEGIISFRSRKCTWQDKV